MKKTVSRTLCLDVCGVVWGLKEGFACATSISNDHISTHLNISFIFVLSCALLYVKKQPSHGRADG